MKIVKRSSYFAFAFISAVLFMGKVGAATASINISASKNQVVVGSTVNVTVKISSASTLGSWDYTLKYDSSVFSLVSSDPKLHNVGYGDGKIKTKSYNYTFKAIKSGSSKFYISTSAVADWVSVDYMSVTTGTRTIKAITQTELEASYSKNNNLSSLEVAGYTLDPVFDKDTLTYNVSASSEVTKITINAKKSDNTASVTGTGEFDISEGLNVFEVKVTAQNGNLKTYTINVNVEDKNPIIVKIGDKELVVVKRKDLLIAPSLYTEKAIKINEMDVPAFYNEITNYTLVGLKDAEGNISLYIYNEEDNTYTLYNELTLNRIIFYPLPFTKEIKDYKKTTITINNVLLDCYKFDLKSNYAIVYGKNIETGEDSLYLYDSKENTLQLYNDEHILKLKKDNKYAMIVIIIESVSLLTTIVVIILMLRKNKKLKNNLIDISDLIEKKKSRKIKKEETE